MSQQYAAQRSELTAPTNSTAGSAMPRDTPIASPLQQLYGSDYLQRGGMVRTGHQKRRNGKKSMSLPRKMGSGGMSQPSAKQAAQLRKAATPYHLV